MYPIQREAAVHLLAECVKLATVNPPGNEKLAADWLAELLTQMGWAPTVEDLGENRANVVAVLKGTGEKPALVYNGHLDVVPVGETPWTYDPFAGISANGRLYGRGTSDMKGGLVAMVMAGDALQRAGVRLKGDLIISGVADEETGALGAKAWVQAGGLQGVGAIVIGEPTDLDVYVAEKGACWIEVTTYGKTAHGSMPDLGINAVMHMAAALSALSRLSLPFQPHALFDRPTLSVGTIQGGNKTNVVPDRCTATIDMRTLPGMRHAEVLGEVRHVLDGLREAIPAFTYDMRVIAERAPVAADPHAPIVETALTILEARGRRVIPKATPGYATDASVFQPASGAPFLIFGPGIPHLAHQPDEYIEIDTYLESIELYCELAQCYLS
ncbi:MAG: M20 family metallopeptidase [Nitrospinae bacterium]|nr:M20 family metallopeptidase [Nitrospinota bacterium]